jgi:hypothetical protein
MSHALRRMQRPGVKHLKTIASYDLPSFWTDHRLPTPQQQADTLILWVGNRTNSGSPLRAYPEEIAAIVGAAISTRNAGLNWLVKELANKDLLRASPPAQGVLKLWEYTLTMAGWERYAALKKANIESRTAFMAMQYGDPDLNRVVDECFRPAVARTGFELRLLTDRQPAGNIDDQLRAAILSSRFVICDLTHGNAGAYWEGGFGEGLGLPVIYTCEKSAWEKQKTHFDTNHLVTIIWHLSDLKRAGDALAATIRATLRADAKQTDD